MILKNYQENAIGELIHDSVTLLNSDGKRTLVFKAPTGSGKTIIMAEFLKQLSEVKELNAPLSVIWAAPRKLHKQSKKKLEDYYDKSRAITCSYFDDLSDRVIAENEILFFNWESINKKNAIYIRENEQENNLSAVIERTRDESRKILLVIDESHFAAGSADAKELTAAKKLRNDIEPDLTVEVSATPIMPGDKTVSVTIDEVKLEGMIKKSVIVNPEYKTVFKGDQLFSEIPGPDNDSDELILLTALEKRQELERAYKDLGLSIRPLLLIQIPDKNKNSDVDVREKITAMLKNNDITEANGKLKIYLSEEKSEGLDLVSKEDDETDVLIFKQGIALGWDCPRAQILVLFREWKSLTFSIQTIGRIMRMPEPDTGYYKSGILNHAYVYTNFPNIEVQEDLAGGYVTIQTSKRKPEYRSLALKSVYSKRQREKTRLTPTYIQIFLNEAKKYKLKDKIDTLNQRVSASLIRNFEAEEIDRLAHRGIKGTVSIKVDNEEDLQGLFDQFAVGCLAPEFFPEPRSVDRVKTAIYYFFSTALGIKYTKRFREVINIAISDKNIDKFKEVIGHAKREYLKGVVESEFELVPVENWNIPEIIVTARDMEELDVKKSIMEPFLYDKKWKTEKAFIEFLDRNEKVEWWFKNGDGDATYFAVPYEMSGKKMVFYVDFIVKFKDGSVGLYDPHGKQFADLEAKAMGLSQYIQSNKGLKGGIVNNTDEVHYSGAWQVYNIESKGWEILEMS